MPRQIYKIVKLMREMNLIIKSVLELKKDIAVYQKELEHRLDEIKAILIDVNDASRLGKLDDKKNRIRVVIRDQPRVKFGTVGLSPHTREVIRRNEEIIRRLRGY